MSKPELICSTYYSECINYAAQCCNHVVFAYRLVKPVIKSDKIIVENEKCPVCQEHLVFGIMNGENSIRRCAHEHLGKILSMFNRTCILKKPFGTRFQEVGKLWYVRIFKKGYNDDAEYYIVPFDKPELSGSCMHFEKGIDFRRYMKLID